MTFLSPGTSQTSTGGEADKRKGKWKDMEEKYEEDNYEEGQLNRRGEWG